MATIIHTHEPVSSLLDANPSADGRAETCETFSTDERRLAQIRSVLMSDAAATTLAETFRALGDPTRVRILDALSRGELCVCEISALVNLSESAVSHQLRLLRSLRVVRARRQGRMVYYTLDDHHVRDLFAQGLRHVEEHELARVAAGRR
jgi:DNA-binding transcriptional ArsR family regulator